MNLHATKEYRIKKLKQVKNRENIKTKVEINLRAKYIKNHTRNISRKYGEISEHDYF